MAILNAMLSGGIRRVKDFYPTPSSAVHALIPFIVEWKDSQIWECACGDGAISKVLIVNGFDVYSSDIEDYGFGETKDFLTSTSNINCVVTNPPFNRSEQFIRKAISNKTTRMALLLKSNYWSAAKRVPLFKAWRPKTILCLTWRLDFTGAGAPHTDCHWVIWDGIVDKTEFKVIYK